MLKNCRHCGKEFDAEADIVTCCSIACADAGYHAAKIEEYWALSSNKELRKFRTPIPFFPAQNPEAWAWADKWDRTQNAYLWGNEGIGKTALAKYILSKEIEDGRTVYIPSVIAIQQASKSFTDCEPMLNRLKMCGILLLDDIHACAWSESGLNLLRTAIDYRHEAHLRTIITANVAPVNLTQRFDALTMPGWGVQFMRRLIPCKEWAMIGESYRKEIQAETNRKESD